MSPKNTSKILQSSRGLGTWGCGFCSVSVDGGGTKHALEDKFEDTFKNLPISIRDDFADFANLMLDRFASLNSKITDLQHQNSCE